MSIVGAVLGESRNIQNPAVPLSSPRILDYLGGQPSATGRRVTEEGALRLGTVYACVSLKAETVASLPLQVFRRVGRNKELATDHPLYRILHTRPNPWMTSATLRETLEGHLCLWGNAFAEVMLEDNGQVSGLFPLRPDRMERPRLSQAGMLIYRYTLPDGQPKDLPQSRVLHIRALGCDGLWGYSPIQLQREAIALALTAEEFQARFFANDARPGGVLQVKGQLSQDAANRLKGQFEASQTGLSNAHRLAVLEEGIEWKQVGMPLQDAQFLQLRQYQRSEIASWFRIPPHMIGDVDRSTSWGSGIDAQTTGMVVFTLRPDLVRWEQQINVDLFNEREQTAYFAEHNLDGLLRGDSSQRQAFYTAMLDRGVFSINDVLALENRNPVEGGDQRLVQANMVPLDMVGQAQLPVESMPNEQQPPPSAAEESSSGIDSVEVGRLLLNIQRLEEAGENELAQALREKLAELILNPARSATTLVELRSVTSRLRLREDFRPILSRALQRVVRREVEDIQARLESPEGRAVDEGFLIWLERYEQDKVRPLLEQVMASPLTAYAGDVEDEVLAELGIPSLNESQAPFVAAYGAIFSGTYAERSVAQMRALMRDTTDDLVQEALQQRLAEWLSTRAEKVARIESVRAGEAVAHDTYKRGGVTRLTWRETPGRHCAYCNRLDGKTVGIDQHFIAAGADLVGAEGDPPMKVRGAKRYPPAHRTCKCVVRPA